jgi:hypothetical protein
LRVDARVFPHGSNSRLSDWETVGWKKSKSDHQIFRFSEDRRRCCLRWDPRPGGRKPYEPRPAIRKAPTRRRLYLFKTGSVKFKNPEARRQRPRTNADERPTGV